MSVIPWTIIIIIIIIIVHLMWWGVEFTSKQIKYQMGPDKKAEGSMFWLVHKLIINMYQPTRKLLHWPTMVANKSEV